ncbi:MAG: recombinase family protein, partial [Thermoplasmata archaeon]
MNSIAALYARVSSEQQEHERTIDSQLAALGDLARSRGWEVPPALVYRDEGYSGSRLDRPGLDALRDAASEGKVSRLVVYCPDRLARNYVHQQILLEELEHRGVEVHFVERPVTDRPEDKLLVQMQGVIAEYERTKILERTRRGRLYKARMGLWLNWGTPPYGYRLLPREKNTPMTPVVEETEASWVRQMFAWVTEEGLS